MNTKEGLEKEMKQTSKRDAVRQHLQTTYHLKDEQVELVLKSSSSSITSLFTQVEEAFLEDPDFETIRHLAHGLKGLLRNVGEFECADIAEVLEKNAGDQKSFPYKQEFGNLFSMLDDLINPE